MYQIYECGKEEKIITCWRISVKITLRLTDKLMRQSTSIDQMKAFDLERDL